MKKRIPTYFKLACLLLFLCANTMFSQQYDAIDNLVKAYPKSFSSPAKLAEKINADFTTDTQKARAIFTWIGHNIKYDLKAYKNGGSMVAYSYSSEADRLVKEKKFRDEYAKKTLSSQKGVCQDYSALFHTVCDLTGLKCIDIIGTSKAHPAQIGKLPKASDHEWNAVKIGAEWKFIDVTWASGSVSIETGKFKPEFNDAYFFTAPEVFFLNHFPNDKRLLMVDKTEQDFAALPLYYGPYLQAKYEIISPEKGLISAKANAVNFEIIDFPQSNKIAYVFTSENQLREVPLSQNGNATRFTIPIGSKSRGFLTIYVNSNAIVSYKIER